MRWPRSMRPVSRNWSDVQLPGPARPCNVLGCWEFRACRGNRRSGSEPKEGSMISRRAMTGALLTGCGLLQAQSPAQAASAAEINAGVNDTLQRFYYMAPGSQQLAARAAGVLVFPTV